MLTALFPLLTTFETSLHSAGADFVDAHDLLTALFGMAAQAQSLEDQARCNYALFSDDGALEASLADHCGAAQRECGAQTRIKSSFANVLFDRSLSLLVSTETPTVDLELLVGLEEIEWHQEGLSYDSSDWRIEVDCWRRVTDIADGDGVLRLLGTPTTAAQIHLAVDLDGDRKAQSTGTTLERFTVTETFVAETMSSPLMDRSDGPAKLLKALCEVVLGLNAAKSHALREGAGGNNRQLVIAGAKAFRHDVDYEWHLHYWRTLHGTIEFSNLVPHNNFDISDPTL